MQHHYFDVTIPVFIKNLTNVKKFLEHGLTHAKGKGMTETEFLAQSLTPDMYQLKRQVQIATDNAKGAAARLAGVEPLKIEDTEETVAELIARIDQVIAYLEAFTPEQFDTAAERKIVLHFLPDQYQTGADYLTDFALPNFFFHVSMVYALIRAQGAPLGKTDFIGGLNLHPIV